MANLIEFREILRYVPGYRDKVFVVAMDGVVVEDENFSNILRDIALLNSLNIRVVLCHGASHQLKQKADEQKVELSNADGTGITDAATLDVAITVGNRLTHEILEGLSVNNLRAAHTNAVVAHPAGILNGVDMQHTGTIERVDAAFIKSLMDQQIVPVVPPLGFDGEGATFRLNSDHVATEIALALGAIKLIFITPRHGIEKKGTLVRQIAVADAEKLFKTERDALVPEMVSKLEHGWRACRGGVERVHIISGQVKEGLLAEVFSPTGVGTLIHVNEYQAVRKATRKDASTIHRLIADAVEKQEIVARTKTSIEKAIGDYFIFEIDGNTAGCVALHPYPEANKGELACLAVGPHHLNQGVGRKLLSFVEKTARERGYTHLFCLSTQAINFFQRKGGFEEVGPDHLPAPRRKQWEESGRNSRVLSKALG